MRDQLRRLARNGPAVWTIVILAAMLCGTLMAFDNVGGDILRFLFRIACIGFVVFMVFAILRNRVLARRDRR